MILEDKLKPFITKLLWVASFLQVIFFFSPENVFAIVIILYGWNLLKITVINTDIMLKYPVSFLMITGLAFIHYVFPPVFTLLEFKPVVNNLLVPINTFWHQFLLLNTIVFTHWLYRKLSGKKNIFRNILQRLNCFKPLTDTEIWIMGFVGLLSAVYTYFIYGKWQNVDEDKGALGIIAGILGPFIWMPVVIPFYKLRNIDKKISASQKRYLIIYSISAAFVCIASNVRTLLFSGIITFVLLYLLGVLFEKYSLDIKKYYFRIFVFLVIGIFAGGELLDLGTAMVVARQDRYSSNTQEFLMKTIEISQDKTKLDAFRQIKILQKGNNVYLVKTWDETYLSNYFLNRYCNLKISDNCLFYAEKIGYANPKMKENLNLQISAFLPNQLLGFFKVSEETKKDVASYSLTDYLYSLAIGDSNVLGSFILGSFPGLGMAIWGYYYLLIMIPLFIIIFYLFDSFVLIRNKEIFFSFLFFTSVVNIVNYFNDHHVFTFEIRMILRTYLENVFFYVVFIKIVRSIMVLFK